MVSVIVAAAKNNVIGKDNKMLWHLPADMKYFKAVTMGHPVIMGRKTFESLKQPLTGRINIIITKNKDYTQEGCMVVHSVTEAIKKAQQLDKVEVFIIGGGEIYRQSLPFTDKIYLTRVNAKYEGDAFFPELPEETWGIMKEEMHKPDEKNKHPYSFIVYERKK